MCLKFIDTEKERDIEVGLSWPYQKLEPYECLISDEFYQKGVIHGDKINITLSMTNFWQNLRPQYNEEANLPENKWGEIPYYEERWKKNGSYLAYTTIQCTVKDLFTQTYGKMPENGARKQIIMEYEYFMDIMANNTRFNETVVPQETGMQIRQWMLS